MAGIHFPFINMRKLVELNIGMSDRIDEGRAESFTILYCDFKNLNKKGISALLDSILRRSDMIVNDEEDYFFILPYTDKYGAENVKKMFDDFFATYLSSFVVSYPADGESAEELIGFLQDSVSTFCKNDLKCLDGFI